MSNSDPYAEHDTGWFGSKLAHSVSHAVSSAAKGIGHAVVGAEHATVHAVKSAEHAVTKIPVLGSIVKAVNSVAMTPYQASLAIVHGERLDHVALGALKTQLSAAKTLAPYVQTVVSFVPGVGTGISGAIGAATALAEGKSITQALIDGAKGALPGGPIAKSAFDVSVAAVSGKGISEVALAALPLPDSQKDMLRQGVQVAKDVAAGKKVDKILLDRVNANLDKLPNGIGKAVQVGVALAHGQNIQKSLIKAGSSALLSKAPNMNFSSLSHVVSAAEGATQSGIQKAIGAAQALKNGSPVLHAALTHAVSSLPAGSHERHGFLTAVNVLKKTSGNMNALGMARRALPSVDAQNAFDSAIGTVSQVVSANPAALAKRAGSSFTPAMGRVKGVISAYQPNLKNAMDTLTRNPALMAEHPMVLAHKFGTTQQTVLDAIRRVSVSHVLPWRSLTPTAARFVKKWHPNAPLSALTHGTEDTAGLTADGTQYVVVAGDSPWAIAQKLSGNGANWTQLKALNTDKKPTIDKNVWTGEILNIPASWQKPTAAPPPSPGPALPSQPAAQAPTGPVTPAAPPSISIAPSILQAKSILVAWSKTDGVNQAGLPDYGLNVADLSTAMGPRDNLELQAFQNWDNKASAAGLPVNGQLDAATLAALQQWAETRASQAIPSASIPGQIVLPPMVISALPPVTPHATGFDPSDPGIVPSATPVVAPTNQPATPASVAANKPAASGSKMAPALAGAAVGGVLFGLPGAIIGGIAGAAIA